MLSNAKKTSLYSDLNKRLLIINLGTFLAMHTRIPIYDKFAVAKAVNVHIHDLYLFNIYYFRKDYIKYSEILSKEMSHTIGRLYLRKIFSGYVSQANISLCYYD